MSKHGAETKWILDKKLGWKMPRAAFQAPQVGTPGRFRFNTIRFGHPTEGEWASKPRARGNPGADLVGLCESKFPPDLWTLEDAEMGAGAYYPRIWRPGMPLADQTPERGAFLKATAATLSLLDQMRDVFRSVEPEQGNAGAFGHRMRELLVLACTQFESLCKELLRDNGYERLGRDGKPVNEKKWSLTGDYLNVLAPLQLDAYSVALPLYPEWEPFKPFDGWNQGTAPNWWTAYNAAKHDVANKLDQASLASVIRAMGAVYVMLVACFGQQSFGGPRSLVPCNDMLVCFTGAPWWDCSDPTKAPYVPATDGVSLVGVPFFKR
jgi:hypothetical protein